MGDQWFCDLPGCEIPDEVIEVEKWFPRGKRFEREIASNEDAEGQSGGLFEVSQWSGIELPGGNDSAARSTAFISVKSHMVVDSPKKITLRLVRLVN